MSRGHSCAPPEPESFNSVTPRVHRHNPSALRRGVIDGAGLFPPSRSPTHRPNSRARTSVGSPGHLLHVVRGSCCLHATAATRASPLPANEWRCCRGLLLVLLLVLLLLNARAMSFLLPHLQNGWEVDQAIVTEENRVVVIRFGHDHDPECMLQDEVLAKIAEDVKNFAVIYLVDITDVPDFNTMYELYDDCTTMFFFRNRHIMVDLGTGNNNKINWALTDKQEMIDIIETVYRGAKKGRGLVVSPHSYNNMRKER